MTSPKTPTPDLVRCFLQKWECDPDYEKYRVQEQALRLVFNLSYPKNLDLDHVALKVSVLNDFYSTNIYDTFTVAKHIHGKKVDARLSNGDLSLVNELAQVEIKKKTRNFYSFASKFCSHHFPERFPIFDSYVEKMLWHYCRADNFFVFERTRLKNYAKFFEIIKAFQTHYGLSQFSLREIDIFLWIYGKEVFPKKTKAK